jgi:hypothetical protein
MHACKISFLQQLTYGKRHNNSKFEVKFYGVTFMYLFLAYLILVYVYIIFKSVYVPIIKLFVVHNVSQFKY